MMPCDDARAPIGSGATWCGSSPVAGSSLVFTAATQFVAIRPNRGATSSSYRRRDAIATAESTGQAWPGYDWR